MLDIGLILQAPMQDKAWIKKCLIIGLLTLVPIVGALNALGWMRAYAEARLRGESELPEAGFDYLGRGWRMFLAFLPLAGVVMALYLFIVIVMGIGSALNSETIMMIGGGLGTLAMLPVVLWLVVFNPGMMYLHIVHEEKWASLRLSRQWDVVRRTGTEYLLLWVAFIVCNLVGQLGFIACGVGLLVSLPYAYAMQGAAIAEYARVTNRA